MRRSSTPGEHAKNAEVAATFLRTACVIELLKHHQLASSDPRLLADGALRLRSVLLALSTYDARRMISELPQGLRRRGRPSNAGGKIMIYLGELASIYEHCSGAAGKARRATVSKYPTAGGDMRRGRFASFAVNCFLIAGHDVTEAAVAKAWERRARKQ